MNYSALSDVGKKKWMSVALGKISQWIPIVPINLYRVAFNLGLGYRRVSPIILREQQKKHTNWYHALYEILLFGYTTTGDEFPGYLFLAMKDLNMLDTYIQRIQLEHLEDPFLSPTSTNYVFPFYEVTVADVVDKLCMEMSGVLSCQANIVAQLLTHFGLSANVCACIDNETVKVYVIMLEAFNFLPEGIFLNHLKQVALTFVPFDVLEEMLLKVPRDVLNVVHTLFLNIRQNAKKSTTQKFCPTQKKVKKGEKALKKIS